MVPNISWLQKTENFFFRGAAAGWAGGADGLLLHRDDGAPGMEEWRDVTYTNRHDYPGFELVDRWGIDPCSGKPSGHILITLRNIPVWCMWIGGGSYEKEVFPFLRKVLSGTYQSRSFCGGRGPEKYLYEDLLYTNKWEGDFSQFSGREQIEFIASDGTKHSLGTHDYRGGSLVFQKPD